MCSTDIKKDIPLIPLISFDKAIMLQRIHNTFILRPTNLISELDLFKTVNPLVLDLFYPAAFRIFKKDSRWSILKYTLDHMNLISIFVIDNILAVQVCTLIELLIRYKLAIESLFTVDFLEIAVVVHAFVLDQFQFGANLLDVFLGEYLFLFLDDGGREWLQGPSGGQFIFGFERTDANLINFGWE